LVSEEDDQVVLWYQGERLSPVGREKYILLYRIKSKEDIIMIDLIVPEETYTREEMISDQRTMFAIKACHMMGYSIEKTARLIDMDEYQIRFLYGLIDDDCIDFNAGIDD
jgi:hypothetical protein